MKKPIRLVITKSNRHISAQIISVLSGDVMLNISTANKYSFPNLNNANINDAFKLGHILSCKLKSMGIVTIHSYDRKYPYHGKIQQFIEATKKNKIRYYNR